MKPQSLAIFFAATIAVFLLAGCSREKKETETTEAASPATQATALKGPQVIQDMIAAHGGMDAWKNAPTFSFTDQWGDSPPTTFVVEQGRRRAYFEVPGTDVSVAWDGEKAWSMNWPTQTPVRFLALLNYYFINIPWLTQDPGVKLAGPETGTLPGDSTRYTTVMMTFEPGTGDTPDDYYRLYIDPQSKMLRAVDYIVTYDALLDEGETSTPEHCLVYDQMTTADGLQLPAHFTIYEAGKVYAACTISNYSLSAPFDEARMTMPPGAVIDTSSP
jgi:hypothetical protein